jgi:polysaccharide pyruvyl transferase WcaK-like protein
MQINLLGYYGFHNIGDDLMLCNLLDYFIADNRIQRINVFCREAYYPAHSKVKYLSLNRLSRLHKVWQLAKNEYSFWGGGTCIFESEDNKGIFELLRMQSIAKFSKSKFAFLGIGIGDLKSDKYISTAKQLLKNSFFCYFREQESLEKANKLLSSNNYCLGGDLVFLSDIEPVQQTEELKKISFSGHYNFTKYPLRLVADNLKELIDKLNCKIYFLPAHTGNSYNDNEYHKRLAAYLDPETYKICDWKTPDEYVQIMEEMNFHIGIRLHSLIIADLLGIPNCGISYSPKITYYLNKTQVMPDIRDVDLENNDLVKKISIIKEHYKYPEKFIETERISALSCLDKIFSYG